MLLDGRPQKPIVQDDFIGSSTSSAIPIKRLAEAVQVVQYRAQRDADVDIGGCRARDRSRGNSMAAISEFSIVTYERKPGCWRAAVTRKANTEIVISGYKVRSVVTPDDCASESDAQLAAHKLIRRL
jgi:hypothetical protein